MNAGRPREAVSASASRIADALTHYRQTKDVSLESLKETRHIAEAISMAIENGTDGFKPIENDEPGSIGVTAVQQGAQLPRHKATEVVGFLLDDGYVTPRSRRSYQIVSPNRTYPPRDWQMRSKTSVNTRLGSYEGGDIVTPLIPFKKGSHGKVRTIAEDYLSSYRFEADAHKERNYEVVEAGLARLKTLPNHIFNRYRYVENDKSKKTIWWFGALIIVASEDTVNALGDNIHKIQQADVKHCRMRFLDELESVGLAKPKSLAADVSPVLGGDIPAFMVKAAESQGTKIRPNGLYLRVTGGHFTCPDGLVSATVAWIDPDHVNFRAGDYFITQC